MTPAELAALREATAAATPGPWTVRTVTATCGEAKRQYATVYCRLGPLASISQGDEPANAALIAAAPALLAAVVRLTAALAAAEERADEAVALVARNTQGIERALELEHANTALQIAQATGAIVDAEREACARIADECAQETGKSGMRLAPVAAEHIAAKIRARRK